MAFTQVTVTHTFQNPDGTAAAGTVRFSLSERMTNGTVSVMPAEPVTATLDASGNISVALPANDDTGTAPSTAHYDVTIDITGARTEEYAIVLSHTTTPVDLGTLLPSTSQVE